MKRLLRAAGRGIAGSAILVIRTVRQLPVTLAVITLMWLLAVAVKAVSSGPGDRVSLMLGASVHSMERLRLFSFLTSAMLSDGLGYYLMATALLVGVGAIAERRWGPGRYLWVLVAGQFSSVALGLVVIALARLAGSSDAADLSSQVAIGPWPMLVAALMAVSAGMTPVWSRRIRVGTGAVVAAQVLYHGQLPDMLLLSAAVTGLVLGRVLPRSTVALAPLRSSVREQRAVLAVLMVVTAFGPLLAVFRHRSAGPLRAITDLVVPPRLNTDALAAVCAEPALATRCAQLTAQLRLTGPGPVMLSLLPIALLLVLTFGLYRGRRFAWLAAIALHVVFAGLGLLLFVQGLLYRQTPALHRAPFVMAGNWPGRLVPLLVPLLVIAILMRGRRSFTVRAPRGTFRSMGHVLALTTAGLWLGYVLVGTMLRSGFAGSVLPSDLALDFPLRLIPPGYLGLVTPSVTPVSYFPTLLTSWIGVAFWASVLAAMVQGLRAEQLLGTRTDAAAARRILRTAGGPSLSYLTTWSGNTYWFTSSRTSYVAYRVRGGVAIAMGDPIGPVSERSAALQQFARFCATQSWTPCFYGATEAVATLGTEVGWGRVQVAEEAYLALPDLAFTGRKFQDVRTAISRAGREGITAHWVCMTSASPALLRQVTELSQEWVSRKGLPEMGFTLGGLPELLDPEVRCVLAIDADGVVHGIASWLPVWSREEHVGWTLDYMRRRTAGFNGVMEFLIATAALQFKSEGAQLLSLSGAPLAAVEPITNPTALQRLLERTGHTLEPVYGFRSLLAFKAKFQPHYRPLYLVYPESAALPRIGNAISRAYLPHLSATDVIRLLRALRGHRRPAPQRTDRPGPPRTEMPTPPQSAVPELVTSV